MSRPALSRPRKEPSPGSARMRYGSAWFASKGASTEPKIAATAITARTSSATRPIGFVATRRTSPDFRAGCGTASRSAGRAAMGSVLMPASPSG